jgi:hypothetical protein
MPTSEEVWRAEFEKEGETAIRDALNFRRGSFPEPKLQFAFRWLREQTAARNLRDKRTYRYVRWTFWAAGAAVVVGIIGVVMTLYGH